MTRQEKRGNDKKKRKEKKGKRKKEKKSCLTRVTHFYSLRIYFWSFLIPHKTNPCQLSSRVDSSSLLCRDAQPFAYGWGLELPLATNPKAQNMPFSPFLFIIVELWVIQDGGRFDFHHWRWCPCEQNLNTNIIFFF